MWWLSALALAGMPSDLTQRSWGVEDGLPQSSVTGLALDADGYLWLTTFGGVARFDGVRFVSQDASRLPGLPGSRFVGAASAADGSVWVGAEQRGLARIQAGRVRDVRLHAENAVLWGPRVDGEGVVHLVAGDTHHAVTPAGVQTRTLPLHLGNEPGLGMDRAGNLWALQAWGAYCLSEGCPEPRQRAPSDALTELLVEGAEPLLLPYDWPPPPMCGGEPARWVFHWQERTWCANGLRLWTDGASLTVPEGFLAEGTRLYIRSILVDREDALWVGTLGGGLHLVRDLGVRTFGEEDGLEGRTTWATAEFGGALWVAQDAGMKWLGQTPPPAIAAMTGVRSMSASDRGLWLASFGGLYLYDGGDLRLVESGQFLAVEAHTGGAWAAGPGRVVRVRDDGEVQDVVVPLDERFQPYFVRQGPDGSVWVGGEHPLLYRLRPDGTSRSWSAADGIPPYQLRDILFLDDEVWLGTYGGGLLRLRDGRWKQLGIEQGLCETVVSRILLDAQGRTLWTLGNRGISRMDVAELRRAADGGTPAECDLFRGGEGNWNGGFRSAVDGALWFPTISGLIRIDPAAPATRRRAPAVVIEEVLVGGRPVQSGATIPPGQRDLRFTFTGFGLADREAVVFRHRLDGFDKGWSRGREGVASYTNLSPGTYRFLVSARGPRSSWSEPRVFQVTFQSQFYETVSGRLVLILGGSMAMLLLAIVVYRWREREAEVRASRQREAQSELERSRRLDAVAQLASGVAHDFNNLLTSVLLHADALRARVPPDLRDEVSAIAQAADRARRLSGKLMIRGEHLSPAVIPVDEAVERDLALVRRMVPEDIHIDIDVGARAEIFADPSRVEQVLLNLVTNAAQATGRGGRVRVTTRRVEVDTREAEAHGTVAGRFVVVAVTDDGPGVPTPLQERIFEPFFTTKPVGAGTGLGLTTVRTVAREAGGFVTLTSRPGETTFSVFFPLHGDATPSARADSPVTPLRNRGRVLVVDDLDLVRRPIVRMLRAQGHEVRDCGDPRLALDLDFVPDVLVSDVVMPHLSGPELAARLRQRFPGLPTIFISAHPRDVVVDRGVEEDVVVLTKPFEPKELLALVDRLVRSGPGR